MPMIVFAVADYISCSNATRADDMIYFRRYTLFYKLKSNHHAACIKGAQSKSRHDFISVETSWRNGVALILALNVIRAGVLSFWPPLSVGYRVVSVYCRAESDNFQYCISLTVVTSLILIVMSPSSTMLSKRYQFRNALCYHASIAFVIFQHLSGEDMICTPVLIIKRAFI